MIIGSITRRLFGFVMEVSALANEPFVLFCCSTMRDLTKMHHSYKNDQEVKYLSRCSLFTNPKEMASSALKAAMKHQLSNPVVQRKIYDRVAPRGDTLHARRMRVLRREVENCLPTTYHTSAING